LKFVKTVNSTHFEHSESKHLLCDPKPGILKQTFFPSIYTRIV